MTSKVKISELVASTGRYAKKAALAADKNKNGRLSKTEAKSLPKDLRDDYARQAKLKSSITPGGFARDQAAYVAVNAKKADKNKDGVLSATEAKNLPATLKNNYAGYVAAHGSTPDTSSGFTGSGKGVAQTLGGKPFSNLPLSNSINALVAKLATDSDFSTTYAAAFKGKPSDLSAPLSNPEANKQFFNDLLFRATGTTYDKDYPNYYTPDGLSVAPLTAAQALSDLKDEFSGNATATSGDVPADAKAFIDAMKQPGVKFFRLNWNNQDDASFDATVAINQATGEIRAVGWVNEP